MLRNPLILGVLAQSVSAVELSRETSDLTDFTLSELNREVGNIKYVRPHEAEPFSLDGLLSDFYGQVGTKLNRNRKVDYEVPKVRYTDPKPFSYTVNRPTIQYREVEHIRPAKIENPVPNYERDFYPEGYTNEYLGYDRQEYGDNDHSHFTAHYGFADIVPHSHDGPDAFARHKHLHPEADNFFVPVVVDPEPQADYTGVPYPYSKNPVTYTD